MYLVDGGQVHRAFLHIDDASDAFQAIIDQSEASKNEIFNVGNPANNMTIRELALLMQDIYRELTGITPGCELIDVSGEEFYGKGYEDGDRLPPDVRKLQVLGWHPRRNTRQTFTEAMQYYLAKEQSANGSLVQAKAI